MKCPRCKSQKVELVEQYPTLDYAEHGEYVIIYRCLKCDLEFRQTTIADEDIFDSLGETKE